MIRFIPSTSAEFFPAQQTAWSAPPIDGVGYIPSAELLKKSDDELRNMIVALEKERYNVTGWRNHQNRWREFLGLDTTHDKIVMDFGCGCGVEALQFARNGNYICIADIVESNVALADRVLQIYGHGAMTVDRQIVEDVYKGRGHVDIFYSAGVLHHTPRAADILREATKWLYPDGEIRLMLYSDKGWSLVTETAPPPIDEDVETNSHFQKFVGVFDAVGAYADWYSADKIQYRFPFLDLVRFEYICSDDAYCIAILKQKGA